ncbi:MAG: hypothetical protein GDA48_01080 [Hormoscilla sp. GM102CHS1]|nr:hypothetical protein [Hormoscilla sp. GM102CHS1]
MSKKSSLSKSQTDWQRIDRMDDGDIDLSNCPEVTEQMFAKAVVRRPAKAEVMLTIDRDVWEWFESKGQGYERQINA